MAGIQPIGPATSARSFPAQVVAGQTGAGSLESRGAPLKPQQLNIVARSRSIIPGFDEDTYPAPYDQFDDGFDFILPGTLTNPDQTPRTHATPFAGWAGSYNGDEIAEVNSNIMDIHSEDFGALTRRTNSAKWATDAEPTDISYNTSIGENELQPITGQMRRMGGYDATQGYGGRGSGPGGINAAPTGKGKYTRFTNPQPTYSLMPAERPFIVTQGGINAVFNDAVQGPYSDYSWGHGDGASPYNNSSAYNPQPEPDTFTGQYTEGPIV